MQTLEYGWGQARWVKLWASHPCLAQLLYFAIDKWVYFHLGVKRSIVWKKSLWKQLLNILLLFNNCYVSNIWIYISNIFTWYIRIFLVTKNTESFFIPALLKEGYLLCHNWKKDKVFSTLQSAALWCYQGSGSLYLLLLLEASALAWGFCASHDFTVVELAIQIKFLLVLVQQRGEGKTLFPSMQCTSVLWTDLAHLPNRTVLL